MTFEDIKKANESIKTMDVKGKQYAEVNQRIKAFRMVEPNGCIETELISLQDGVCVMKAVVMNGEGKMLGSGTAYEKESSSYINKTSYIENCETSAVGRALGMCGFGIDVSVASYEEVTNAINNQEPKQSPQADLDDKMRVLKFVNNNADPKAVSDYICKSYKVSSPNEMSPAQYKHFITSMREKGKAI